MSNAPEHPSRSLNANRIAGWGLLVVAYLWAASTDANSFSPANSHVNLQDSEIAVRYVLSVLFGLGILQLLISRFSYERGLRPDLFRFGSRFSIVGAAIYLALVGAANMKGADWFLSSSISRLEPIANILAFAVLFLAVLAGRTSFALRIIAAVSFVGVVLRELLTSQVSLGSLVPTDLLGITDSLQVRMLRLAVMAGMALPVIAFQFEGLGEKAEEFPRVVKWGRIGMLTGAVGMPLLLCLGAFVDVRIKYALALPVGAIVLGTWCAVFLAWKQGRTPEKWFWLMIALSMGVGQFMGTYAFDGPMAAPVFLGGYNDFARRLLRLGHMYAIILGIAGIFASRETEAIINAKVAELGKETFYFKGALSPWGLLGASLVTLAGLFSVAIGIVPSIALAIGPGLVAFSLGMILIRGQREPVRT